MVYINSKDKSAVSHVCCIGAGYVGGPTSAVMAQKCPDIQFTVVDTDAKRIAAWKSSSLPVYEPGLDKIVESRRGVNLHFSADIDSAIYKADIVLIAVNTPTLAQPNNSISNGLAAALDLTGIEECARRIAQVARHSKIVIEKSTVPCKTGDFISNILDRYGHPGVMFDVLSNPEFLSEGTAIQDLLEPDRVIIGGKRGTEHAQKALASIYAQWVSTDRIVTMDLWSAELAKLASNAILAQRVSSINAISALCEATGANISDVARGCSMDSRIGSQFLRPSIGFGGSCFHKDVASLVWLCESLGLYEVGKYWQQVLRINEYQKTRFVTRMAQVVDGGLLNKRIACLGFAYKGGTRDTRNTPAATICSALLEHGAQLSIYDPKVPGQSIIEHLKEPQNMPAETIAASSIASPFSPVFSAHDTTTSNVHICTSVYEAIANAHVVAVLTAWEEFQNIDWYRVSKLACNPAYVFDGQLVVKDPAALKGLGLHVIAIGSPAQPIPDFSLGPDEIKEKAEAFIGMSQLQSYVDHKVSVIMNDGRLVVGMLRGLDQTTNIIMQECQERIFSEDEGVEIVDLGLYLIRGDNIAVVGLVDEEADAAMDYETIRGAPLQPIRH
ncbi:hypothetical protein GGI25_004059 [Coemansia spiralis]|uniref:UDP-glucose 6-dehydrogenase n=2 Tax=Coemansia TaxID=4863 RepID=A0A9W8G6U8_9FUNG|nr:hypothetical protein GGI25_004059 [Coemansia spiralis]